MPEFRKLDFVGDFQGARQNALTMQRQEGLLADERAAAPIRQEAAQLGLEQAKRTDTQSQVTQRNKTINQVAKALVGLPENQWPAAIQKINPQLEQLDIAPMPLEGLTRDRLTQIVAETQGFINDPGKLDAAAKDFTLSQGQKRFDAEGNVIASVDPTQKAAEPTAPAPQLPASLATEVTAEQAQILEDVFTASGGGDKGVKAVAAQKETFRENTQRANAPAILAERFPKATPEQLKQLQAAVDGGKTVAEGFKAAGKIREKQRQVEKGDTFRQRALEVANRLLENDELDDVTGSIDASDESFIPFGGQKFRGDNEANAIADIKEIGNILTSDNLDIMTGVLSETDIGIIRSLAAGGLDRSRSDDQFRNDLIEIRDRLQKALSPGGDSGGQQSGLGEITEEDIQETMRIHGMTRDEVLNDPRLKG